MNTSIQELIESLRAKTERSQADWQKTSRQNEYSLMLKSATITVDRWIGEGEDGSNRLVDFRLHNAKSEEVLVEVAALEVEPNEYKVISTLHTAVARSYSRLDQTIDQINKEIEGDDVVGEKQT